MGIQPSFYIPHGGGPCFFMEDPNHIWTNMGNFLYGFSNLLPTLPDAIIIISAHWESNPIKINSLLHPQLYYDYYDFPEHTYHLSYQAKGSPNLANRIFDLLNQHKLECQLEENRGWDHGVFIPLKLMFPNENIPIVQLSLHNSLDASTHLRIGEILSILREENILILGSGMSYHNLPFLFSGEGQDAAFQFDEWLREIITNAPSSKRAHELIHWHKAPQALSCHPRPEHLLPLMIVAGTSDQQGTCIFKDYILGKPITAFQFI